MLESSFPISSAPRWKAEQKKFDGAAYVVIGYLSNVHVEI
jgi:hypothetical protein